MICDLKALPDLIHKYKKYARNLFKCFWNTLSKEVLGLKEETRIVLGAVLFHVHPSRSSRVGFESSQVETHLSSNSIWFVYSKAQVRTRTRTRRS